jgi:pyruvate/2-oxoglutarate dehydrogenase complex dihydrolipoamide acyltransferase (E2) component
MNLIEVVILAGVQCLSPVEAAEGTTIVGKVPCAVLIKLDEETGKVDFTPPSAASNPQVIAILVKPGGADAPAASAPDETPTAEGDAQDQPEAQKPELREKRAAKPAKPPERRKLASARKERVAKRKDACGSYKAVWYTNKEGRKKYRCVRTG